MQQEEIAQCIESDSTSCDEVHEYAQREQQLIAVINENLSDELKQSITLR